MRYILIVFFLIFVLRSNGQKIVCLNQDFTTALNDSLISFVKGNLMPTDSIDDIQIVKTLRDNARFSFTDCISKQEYLFTDSIDYPRGWLIIDKSRNRVSFIDQEMVFVFNTLDRKCLIYKHKNCGFDVFIWSKTICGFSDPCYNFQNGYISCVMNKLCHRNTKLIIDSEIGIIKSQ